MYDTYANGVNLTNQQIFLQPKNRNMGFHVQEILQKFTQKDIVISTQVNKFKNNAEAIIINILQKLFECRPISSIIIRTPNLCSKHPYFFVRGNYFQAVKSLLSELMNLKILLRSRPEVFLGKGVLKTSGRLCLCHHVTV